MRREIEILRDRISRLTAASLRISASLDLDTVLREIMEGARALTGAEYGAITTFGKSGQAEDIVSSGYTPEERRRLRESPDGPHLFKHFRNLPGALRLRDCPSYIRSLGFSPPLTRPKTFLRTPMRHRGVHVGNFFLTGKEDGTEFTSEDEEILVLFASQAAVAIANGRPHRDEQHSRADWGAPVDISPAGIVVFDARTGNVVLLNQEAQRIVGRLSVPGRSVTQLPELVTCRRADGQEIDIAGLSMMQALVDAAPVRAEEVVLQVPDGRSVTMLVNAAPIRAEDGTVESLVVTLQDLETLKDTE